MRTWSKIKRLLNLLINTGRVEGADGQHLPAGNRHCLVTCISDPAVSEALCRRKHSLPVAREDVLKCKRRKELPPAEERQEECRSVRWGNSVAHIDLDLLILLPDSPCNLRQPAIIFFAEFLSIFHMHWQGQCSAPWQMGCLPAWSLLPMLGTAQHHRNMERSPS